MAARSPGRPVSRLLARWATQAVILLQRTLDSTCPEVPDERTRRSPACPIRNGAQ